MAKIEENKAYLLNPVNSIYDLGERLKYVIDQSYKLKSWDRFFKRFKDKTPRQVFNYCFYEFDFKPDPSGTQIGKTPQALDRSKIGNCFDYTIFLGAILNKMGYKCAARFISLRDRTFSHVYLVAFPGPIYLDATINKAQTRKQYKKERQGLDPCFNCFVSHELKKDFYI